MDRNVRASCSENCTLGFFTGLTQGTISVHSLPNDLRFRLVPPDPYCNALRVGDDLEDGLDHKNRRGSWSNGSSADRAARDCTELAPNRLSTQQSRRL